MTLQGSSAGPSSKLSHSELADRQGPRVRAPERLPFAVLLNQVRSLYNVGSIFRTADGAGVEKIWICGITGFPPDTRISKTALGAEASVPWEYMKDARECLRRLKAEGYQIVLLEQTKKSVPYFEFEPRPPLCLVVGSETCGVDEALVSMSDAAIEIPMAGLKISLNVTVAFGIAAYAIRNILASERR